MALPTSPLPTVGDMKSTERSGVDPTLAERDRCEIAYASAATQARMVGDGTITAPELLEIHLDRISRLNPKLNAYRVVLTDSARTAAVTAQEFVGRREGTERVPLLLGVPVAVKDDLDVAGEVTTRGTMAHGAVATQDAEVVRRLRAAGAIIIGKTAVPELCMWPFTETLSFGPTRNPWDTDRAPGGSSGGSAAAVAAGLATLALGSDAGGSIRNPATWCGLYGIKPQRGRVPTAPDDDAWYGLGVVGPLTRTVQDAALFLDATTSTPAPIRGFAAAAARSPGRLRIAISTKRPPPLLGPVGEAQRAAVREAGELLRELGHIVVFRDPDYPAAATASFLPRYLRTIHDNVTTMPHPERLEGRTRAMARMGGLVSDRQIAALRRAEAGLTDRVQRIFDDVDVLITPGTAAGPSRIGAYQRRGAFGTLALALSGVPYHAVFNVTGQPAAAIPWGLDHDGIPLSLQLVGRACDEATVLALSTQIETARPWNHRRPGVS
jgi:amidase